MGVRLIQMHKLRFVKKTCLKIVKFSQSNFYKLLSSIIFLYFFPSIMAINSTDYEIDNLNITVM